MRKQSPEHLLPVGKVVRPHGLDGLLRVLSYAQTRDSFLYSDTVFLQSDKLGTIEHRILSVKPHKNVFLMRLEGVDSLEVAETYRGAEVLVEKDCLKREGDDEYFWFELVGIGVYLDSGLYIGKLEEIIATGSNDIYVVRKGKHELLIPATHDVIRDIDLKNKKMTITEVEGLFDLNEV